MIILITGASYTGKSVLAHIRFVCLAMTAEYIKTCLSLTVLVNDDRLPFRQRSFLLSEIILMIMGDSHQYCFSQMKTGRIRRVIWLNEINRRHNKWKMEEKQCY